METNRKKPSPQEQLANVYDSLADDVFDGHIETGEATNQRASRVARDAINQALSSGKVSGSLPEESSPPEWAKRTDKNEPPIKGQHK
jgi:hypothetical protein